MIAGVHLVVKTSPSCIAGIHFFVRKFPSLLPSPCFSCISLELLGPATVSLIKTVGMKTGIQIAERKRPKFIPLNVAGA